SDAYATLYGSTVRVPVRLRQLSGAADPQTRTFEARYVLEGAAANAPLGATVTVHLSDSVGIDMLQVPVAAVLDQGKGPGIWVLNPSTSTVSFQPVQVRQLGEELATVSGNLHPGQQVVALGVHLLRDARKSGHSVLADRDCGRWHFCLPKTRTRRRPNFHDQGVYRCSGVARSDGTGDAGPCCRTTGEADARIARLRSRRDLYAARARADDAESQGHYSPRGSLGRVLPGSHKARR